MGAVHQLVPEKRLHRRADALVRVSMDKDAGTSPEIQQTSIQGFADGHGIEIVNWVYGIDESGSRKRSAWWAKLDTSIERLEAGVIDTILVWRFSRTARNRLKWAIALDRIENAGGKLLSSTEPIESDTASGKLHLGMMGEFNAYYADMMSESWRETHMRRRKHGLTAEGGPRYGYVKQDDGTYLPHPEEAQLLAQAYRRYLAGDGFSKIARWMNSGGHTTRGGRPWGRVVLTHLLDSGFAAGLIIHRPTSKDGKRDWRMSRATYYPGQHPALISTEEWEQYAAQRQDAPEPSRVIGAAYMLTGIIVCGDCGAPMHVGHQGTEYRCSRALERKDVPGMFMNRARVEQAVREWVGELAGDVERLAAIAAKQRAQTVVQLENVETLEKKINAVKDQLGRITVRWSAGKIPDAAYDAAAAQLDAELKSLDERKRAAGPRARGAIDPRKLIIQLDGYWDGMTVDERRGMLRPLIRQVRIVKPVRQGAGVWKARVQVNPVWEPPVG